MRGRSKMAAAFLVMVAVGRSPVCSRGLVGHILSLLTLLSTAILQYCHHTPCNERSAHSFITIIIVIVGGGGGGGRVGGAAAAVVVVAVVVVVVAIVVVLVVVVVVVLVVFL